MPGEIERRAPARRGSLRRVACVAVALVAMALLAATGAPPAAAQGVAQAAVELGGTLFREHCAPCHGAEAQGQVPGQPMGGQGKDGAYLAPALNGQGHMWHHGPDQLFAHIKRGSPIAASPMRGFEGRLSDDQIRTIIAYLQSLWPERLQRGYRERHGGPHRNR